MFLICLGASAKTIHVPGDSATIQAGINGANGGDTVLVADGVYKGEGNRDIDFGGRKIVLMSENGYDFTHIDCEGSEQEPHRGFIFHTAEDSSTVVDGFWIRNGYAISGGGMLIYNSMPIIKNCRITDSQAISTSVFDGGGAIYVTTDIHIDSCIFENNYSNQLGGAIISEGQGNPTVKNCIFRNNSARSAGGAYYCGSRLMGSSDSLMNCIFVDNYADNRAGAIYLALGCSAYTYNCRFVRNSAKWYGGAIHSRINDSRIIGCVFDSNWTNSGGAIYITQCPNVLEECVFYNNYAEAGGGAICGTSMHGTIIRNCIFLRNRAIGCGGAIMNYMYRWESDMTIDNSTFFGNDASTGSALYQRSSYSSIIMNNCIVAFNSSGYPIISEKYTTTIGLVRPSCTDIYGNDSGDWVDHIASYAGINGNMSIDPLFCDTSNNDLHLADNSPCAPGHPDNSCGTLIGALGVGCGATDVTDNENDNRPESFALHQNYPNPFNPSTKIEYTLPRRSNVTITIFDVLGRKVKTIFDQTMPAGTHTAYWNGTDSDNNLVATGVYFYQIKAGDFVNTKKMLLLK